MKTLYHEHSEHAGIYKIVNLENGRIYIGSTTVFRKRFKSHNHTLTSGKHTNKFLQNDFNKYGTDNFLIEVLQHVVFSENDCLIEKKKKLLAVEQIYIDKYYDGQKNCYNLRKDAADSRQGSKAIKEVNRETDGRCKSPTKETLKKRGEAIRTAKSTQEQKEKAANNARNGLWKDHSANVSLIHKETKEEVLVTTSLRQFAIDRGLSYKSLHQLVRGKIKSSGGWTLVR